MTVLSVNPPFPTFQGSDGYPLENGNIYVGQANMNPLTSPVAAFWDAAMMQPAGQPIKTTGGYPSNNGTPARIYVNGDCSISVIDKKGVIVYSSPSVTDRYNGNVVSVDASSVSFTQFGAGAITQSVQNKLYEMVSVLDFGADRTGVTDSTAAIQNALNSGAKRVRAPYGTYKILATLTIPNGVSLEGDGIDCTIFDGSAASYSSLTNGYHITNTPGTLTQIQDLASDVSSGSATITLTGTPALAQNDIICIYNPTDYSWSNERSYYRAGEWARIVSASGTTVRLQGALADSYKAADVDLYKLVNGTRYSLTGFTVKGLKDTTHPTYGIFMVNAVDSKIENVRVWNCSYTCIDIEKSFNVQVIGCSLQEDMSTNFAGDYGLAITSSQNVNVSGGYFCAARHGITTGGFSDVGSVPCRYIYVSNATITTNFDASTGDTAMDFHADTEYASVSNCVINASVSVGGDNIQLKNNFIEFSADNVYVPVYCTALIGANLDIQGNTIINKKPTTISDFGVAIHIGFLNNRIRRSGTTSICNNKITWAGSTTNRRAIAILSTKTLPSTAEININIESNSITSFDSVKLDYAISITKNDDTCLGFNNILIKNNVTNCGGIAVTDFGNLVANTFIANNVTVSDNDISNGSNVGIMIRDVKTLASIKGNNIRNFLAYGFEISNFGNAAKITNAEVKNNYIFNCLSVATTSAVSNSSGFISSASNGIIKDNAASNNNKYIIIVPGTGTFSAGDVITGATSGVTATIDLVDGTKIGIGTSASGTFTVGETITGAPSGATATIGTANTYTVFYSVGMESTSNAYIARNVDSRALDPWRASITSYMKGSEWEITPLVSYDPPSLATGAGVTTDMATTTGVSVGDIVIPSFSQNLQGITLTGYVRASGVPTARFQNQTGGTIDLAPGYLYGKVIKA